MKNFFYPKQMISEEKVRRNYFRLKIAFCILLLVFTVTVYLNYNYMIFKILIAGNYVYTDSLDKMYVDSVGEENFKGYYKNFDQVVIDVVTEKIRSIDNDRYTYLYTPQNLQYSKDSEKSDALAFEKIEKLSDETVYLRIPNISEYTRKFVESNKEELKKYKNIVIDLRSNYGGFIYDYYKISALFLDKNKTVGFEKTRWSLFTRQEKTKNDKYFDFEKIIILQNKDTASAAEGLIMSLKENLDNVTLIGEKTFGKGIGQVTIPLTQGYAVKATVLRVETPTENSIHNKGIEPDIPFDEYTGEIVDFSLKYIEE